MPGVGVDVPNLKSRELPGKDARNQKQFGGKGAAADSDRSRESKPRAFLFRVLCVFLRPSLFPRADGSSRGSPLFEFQRQDAAATSILAMVVAFEAGVANASGALADELSPLLIGRQRAGCRRRVPTRTFSDSTPSGPTRDLI